VYTLVIGALIPAARVTQALLMVGMYAFSVASSLAMMTCALAESDCLSVLSRSQASTQEFNADIAVLPVEMPWPKRFVGTTTRAGWLPTRIQRRFLTLVRRECRSMNSAKRGAPPVRKSA